MFITVENFEFHFDTPHFSAQKLISKQKQTLALKLN